MTKLRLKFWANHRSDPENLKEGRAMWRLGVEGNPLHADLPPDYIISSHTLPHGEELQPKVVRRGQNYVLFSMNTGSSRKKREEWLRALEKKFLSE